MAAMSTNSFGTNSGAILFGAVGNKPFREVRTLNRNTSSPAWCTTWEVVALRTMLRNLDLESYVFKVDVGYPYEYGSGDTTDSHIVIIPSTDTDHDFMFLKLKMADTDFTLSEEFDVGTFSDRYFRNNVFRPPIKIVGAGPQ